MIEDESLFIRRVSHKNEIHEAMPIDWSQYPRPAYFKTPHAAVPS